MIHLKRAYDEPSPDDGERILVERLWPRGLTKARAAVDVWLKGVAPSPELRKWFGHDPARWAQFKRRYWNELKDKKDDVDVLRRKAEEGRVTFVYAAHDEAHNGALALKEFVERRGGPAGRARGSTNGPKTAGRRVARRRKSPGRRGGSGAPRA